MNKQTVFITVFLLFTISAEGQDVKSYRYRFDTAPADKGIVISEQSLIINYTLEELELESVEIDKNHYYRIKLTGHTPVYDPGKPEIPVFSRLISVPECSDYKIRISDVKYRRLHPSAKKIKGILYPSQESDSKSPTQRKKEFRIDRETYSMKGIIPYDTVRIEPLGIMRGKDLSNIMIAPVRYNPRTNSIEVIISMRIEITNIVPAGYKSEQSSESALFTESFEKSVLNYSAEKAITGFSDKPVRMIVLTDTSFSDHLTPYIKWKTQKGYDLTILYRGKNYAGDSYSEIKETLSDIYKNVTPAPEYLLIIGDTKKVPYYGSGNITDLYYGEFTGDGDYIPEMYIGRLPVSDTTQLKHVLNKLIAYEKYQFSDDSYLSRALLSAGNDASYGKIMNGQIYYGLSNYINSSNEITDYYFYYPQSADANTEDSIRKIYREGLSFINYTGHGDAYGWLDPTLKTGDLDTVSNTGRYTFIISNACQTSTFSSSSSFGNKMVLAENKGAAGFIGGSADTFWDEDYYWAVGVGQITSEPIYSETGLGALDRLFHTHSEDPSEWYISMGQVNYAGNLAVSASTTAKKKYYWEVYNLVGDPSIIPFIGKPDTFSIHIPDTLPNGIRTLTLTGEPFSYIAVSHNDTLWDASYISASGSVELSMPGISDDSCLFVVTGQNKIPLFKTVIFGSVSGEYLNLSGNEINDSDGNNNGMADFGEEFYLAVTVSNLGNMQASDLSVKIESPSDLITIMSDSAYIGILNALSEATLSDRFRIRVNNEIEDMSIVPVLITMTDALTQKEYNIDITLHAPALQVLGCSMDDTVLGNGNYIADPGEKFSLVYRVLNSGSSDASGDFLVSTTDNETIEILDQNIKSGLLKFGEVTEIPVTVQLYNDVANGSYYTVSSSLNCDPYLVNNDFTFRAGKVRESFEAESFSIFPWINNSKIPWSISQGDSYDGIVAARSGTIGHNASTNLFLNAYYNAPDSVKFMYKVSTEVNYDYFIFSINDTIILKKSGDSEWIRYSTAVRPGFKKLQFTYRKDGSTTGGEDCVWIDMVDFVTSGSVSYIHKDLKVISIEPFPAKNKYTDEPIRVNVTNVGKDTVNGFNLAYSVNGNSPVTEFFDSVLISYKDTLTVEFSDKYNFYRYGLYSITSYAYGNSDDYILNDSANLEFRHELTDSLVIYPNPYTEQFTLYINSRYSEIITITMINSAGMIMHEETRNITAGKNPVVIREPWLSPGVYYVRIRTNRGINTLKVVKTKK